MFGEQPGNAGRCTRAWPVTLLLGLCLAGIPLLPAAAAAPDVRVLIDVSGSMRETDPGNLRIPATRLLVNLLPGQARAGVWTFGTEAAPLVPLGRVDADWRALAMDRMARIGSRDRYTDIADGLFMVDRDWQGDPDDPRLVILLTDGQVDVDEDARMDERSRREILEQMVPAMRKRGVRLYAVGLSEAADQRMLEQVSIMTGGFSVVARDAGELLSAFLEIFSAALPVNAVPVERERFQVDASVSELTILALHPYRSEPVALRTPGGAMWTGARHARGVRWLAQDTFSLVHVPQPEPGEWVLHGGGQDTRVHIHSDLQLALEGLPAHLLSGEQFELRLALRDKGGPVATDAFGEILQYRALLHAPDGTVQPLELSTPAPSGATTGFRVPAAPGLYRVEAVALAGILQRSVTQLARVYDEAYVVLQEADDGGSLQRFSLRVREDVLRTGDLRVRAMLRLPDGTQKSLPVTPDVRAARWAARTHMAPGVHEFWFELDGYNTAGRRVRARTEALLFGEPAAPAPSAETTAPAPAAQEDPPDGTRESVVSWIPAITGAIAGLALTGLGAWLWQRRRSAAEDRKDPPATAEGAAAQGVALDEDLPPVVSLTQAPGDQGGPEGRGTS